jgi:hypothetical protein
MKTQYLQKELEIILHTQFIRFYLVDLIEILNSLENRLLDDLIYSHIK